MNPFEPSQEHWELWDAACDGLLSVDDVARLEQQLRDPELREHFLNYFELHADLHFRSCADRAERRGISAAFFGNDHLSNLGQNGVEGAGLTPSNITFGGLSGFISKSMAFYLAIATALTVLVAWSFFSSEPDILPERGRQPVAKLVADSDARWNDGLRLNDTLIEGQVLKLVSGRAQISMSCGAELVLRSPCMIQLKHPNQVDLKDGVLSVSLADWTKEFAIFSEGVQFVESGKQFVVSADAKTSSVEAHAISGKLRVLTTINPDNDSKGFIVSPGEAIRIDPNTHSSARSLANQNLFDTAISDASPFKPLKICNTGLGLSPGDEDSHWKIVDSSIEDFTTPESTVVCNPHRNRHLKNDAARSQWITVNGPDYPNCPPNTMYTFETEFDLSGYDLASLTVVAQVLADNGVTAARINGEQIKFKPWILNVPGAIYKAFHTIEIKEGFIEGVNKIQFDVWNGISAPNPEATNPIALRVEWQAFGRLKSPHSLAFLRRNRSPLSGLKNVEHSQARGMIRQITD